MVAKHAYKLCQLLSAKTWDIILTTTDWELFEDNCKDSTLWRIQQFSNFSRNLVGFSIFLREVLTFSRAVECLWQPCCFEYYPPARRSGFKILNSVSDFKIWGTHFLFLDSYMNSEIEVLQKNKSTNHQPVSIKQRATATTTFTNTQDAKEINENKGNKSREWGLWGLWGEHTASSSRPSSGVNNCQIFSEGLPRTSLFGWSSVSLVASSSNTVSKMFSN